MDDIIDILDSKRLKLLEEEKDKNILEINISGTYFFLKIKIK